LRWAKTKSGLSEFFWQAGYAYFSVSPKDVDAVIQYIANQKQHHATRNFKDELLAFLKQYRIEYNERYLWD